MWNRIVRPLTGNSVFNDSSELKQCKEMWNTVCAIMNDVGFSEEVWHSLSFAISVSSLYQSGVVKAVFVCRISLCSYTYCCMLYVIDPITAFTLLVGQKMTYPVWSLTLIIILRSFHSVGSHLNVDQLQKTRLVQTAIKIVVMVLVFSRMIVSCCVLCWLWDSRKTASWQSWQRCCTSQTLSLIRTRRQMESSWEMITY